MSRTAPVLQPHDEQDEINLTPMLDVVFIMLIFFIVTASFIREAGIDMNRSEGEARPVAADAAILITIAENNEIWLDQRMIDPRALRANIARVAAGLQQASVVIQADRRSSNKMLVTVMDASRQAGVYDIALADSGK